MTRLLSEHNLMEISRLVGKAAGLIIFLSLVLAFKAWLLTVILGWFGVTAIGFWKAVVIVIFLNLTLKRPSLEE